MLNFQADNLHSRRKIDFSIRISTSDQPPYMSSVYTISKLKNSIQGEKVTCSEVLMNVDFHFIPTSSLPECSVRNSQTDTPPFQKKNTSPCKYLPHANVSVKRERISSAYSIPKLIPNIFEENN